MLLDYVYIGPEEFGIGQIIVGSNCSHQAGRILTCSPSFEKNELPFSVVFSVKARGNGLEHRINKEQKAHFFDLFDTAATRRKAHNTPTAAMLLAGHRSQNNRKLC